MLWVGRIVVLILSGVAFLIAASGISNANSWANSIMSMVENAWGLFGASFGPVVILSLFWKRFNYKGACSSIITGFVVSILWMILFNFEYYESTSILYNTELYEIVPGFILATVIGVVVSLLTKAPSKEVTDLFDSVKNFKED